MDRADPAAADDPDSEFFHPVPLSPLHQPLPTSLTITQIAPESVAREEGSKRPFCPRKTRKGTKGETGNSEGGRGMCHAKGAKGRETEGLLGRLVSWFPLRGPLAWGIHGRSVNRDYEGEAWGAL